jgi:Mlc titration factor MtfA (ptsG expression regulator)
LNPLRWWRQRRLARVEWCAQTFDQGFALLPGLAALDARARARLADYTRQFLLDKAFAGAHGLEVDRAMRTRIAQLACWPVLGLGYELLDGWHEVIVYPGAFRARRERHESDASGVVTEWEEELAGESWDAGPLVLSWEDLEIDLAQPEDGMNVVIHEIAHKLDARHGGIADGGPLLPRGMDPAEWQRVFQAAYEDLCAIVEVDAARAPIDPYAATAPEEFFAVSSEYHFLAPALLTRAYPDVARLLARFYAGGSVG